MDPLVDWLPPDLTFSPEHLAANRAGTIHPDQRARLAGLHAGQLRKARDTGTLGCVLALLMLGGPSIFAAAIVVGSKVPAGQAKPLVVMIMLAAIGVAWIPGGVSLLALRKRRLLEGGLGTVEVVRIEGPIQKRMLQTRGGPIFQIIVDSLVMAVGKASWEAAPEGPMVRVYAMAGKSGFENSGFLSLEPLRRP